MEEVSTLLQTFGATEVDIHRYSAELFDEFVDATLATRLFVISDSSLLWSKATPEERDVFATDTTKVFDPLEYGADQAAWTMLAHGIETLGEVVIVLEHSKTDNHAAGNFRVYGRAQWLRETLWATFGVASRDPGAPDSTFQLSRSERPALGRWSASWARCKTTPSSLRTSERDGSSLGAVNGWRGGQARLTWPTTPECAVLARPGATLLPVTVAYVS